ncbi:MAG: hypothetical protein AAF628_01820 [Planctomycetota bacterium]
MRPTSKASGGFTMLELTVVLGLLGGFMLFLVQILDTGVTLFDEGAQGQELADLSNAAAEGTRDSLTAMAGPGREAYDDGRPGARLLVQWVPFGLVVAAGGAEETTTKVQAVRATVHLSPHEEEALLRGRLAERAAASASSPSPADVETRLRELLAEEPRRGRATMLLLPWPAPERDGAFLELRRGLWLWGDTIALDRRREVDVWDLDQLEGQALPEGFIVANTEVVASDLLHFEVAMWSQYTDSFERPTGERGPERVWDSARAGLLSAGEDPERRFSLDLFADSLEDATDDVFPRWLQVTLVVASGAREAVLSEDLSASGSALRVITAQRLADRNSGFVKVGTEWLRYGALNGEVFSGLVRGQRHTPARAHPAGTRVHTGKTMVMQIPLAHGRDAWNG